MRWFVRLIATAILLGSPHTLSAQPDDKLHPNRAGYLAMGMAIDLYLLLPKQASR